MSKLDKSWVYKLTLMFFLLSSSEILADKKDLKDVFILQSKGRDVHGRPYDERLKIDHLGDVIWETPGRGGICPKMAGEFFYKINSKQLKPLLKRGLSAIEEQKSLKGEIDHTNTIRLTSGIKNNRQTTLIKKYSDKLEKLIDEVNEYKVKSKGKSAIKFEIVKIRDVLKAKFSFVGSRPFLLALPKKASDGFVTAGGAGLKYQRRPSSYLVTLSQENPIFEVHLQNPGSKFTHVWFENRNYLHHAQKRDRIVPEVALCWKNR